MAGVPGEAPLAAAAAPAPRPRRRPASYCRRLFVDLAAKNRRAAARWATAAAAFTFHREEWCDVVGIRAGVLPMRWGRHQVLTPTAAAGSDWRAREALTRRRPARPAWPSACPCAAEGRRRVGGSGVRQRGAARCGAVRFSKAAMQRREHWRSYFCSMLQRTRSDAAHGGDCPPKQALPYQPCHARHAGLSMPASHANHVRTCS